MRCSVLNRNHLPFLHLVGPVLLLLRQFVGPIKAYLHKNLKVSDLIAHDSLDVFIDYVLAQRILALIKQQSPVNIFDMLEFHAWRIFYAVPQEEATTSYDYHYTHILCTIILMVGVLVPLTIGVLFFTG